MVIHNQTPFDVAFDNLEEVKKRIQKPMSLRAMKRKFSNAIDETQILVDDLNRKIVAQRELVASPESFDMDGLSIYLSQRSDAEQMKLLLAEEYSVLFGELFVESN